jgi:hypothetical protein
MKRQLELDHLHGTTVGRRAGEQEDRAEGKPRHLIGLERDVAEIGEIPRLFISHGFPIFFKGQQFEDIARCGLAHLIRSHAPSFSPSRR